MGISDNTTVLTKDLDVSGISTARTQTSRVSSSQTIQGNAIWASTFSAGGANFPARISATSFLVAIQLVNGSSSSFTVCATVTEVKKGDVLIPNPFGGAGVSSISS